MTLEAVCQKLLQIANDPCAMLDQQQLNALYHAYGVLAAVGIYHATASANGAASAEAKNELTRLMYIANVDEVGI